MTHDFDRFPELTNSQMQTYYFASPHRQIFDDFSANVVKVLDGDTISVKWAERDFEFPVRLAKINAPEKGTSGAKKATDFLKKFIEGSEVQILVDKNNRVGRYGRLIGRILFGGVEVNEEMVRSGLVERFDEQSKMLIPDFKSMAGRHKI